MMDERAVAEAILIHERCYALLLWLRTAVDRGFVNIHTAHSYLNEAEATTAWIAEHFANLPPACRPEASPGAPLRRFTLFRPWSLVSD
jgi:hypothetical protein